MTLLVACTNLAGAEPSDLKCRLETLGDHRVLHLYGSYYEMGKAHGRLLRSEIRETVKMLTGIDGDATKDQLETMIECRNVWIKHIPSWYREELRGLADGSGLPLDHIEFAQVSHFGITRSKAFALLGSKTVGGWPLLVQSISFVRFNGVITVVYHPNDGHEYVLLTTPGCIGGFAGMNTKGIAIAANPAYHEEFQQQRSPVAFLVREVLRSTSTLQEAVSFFKKTRPADFAISVLADSKIPDCRAVEITPDLFALFSPEDIAENRAPFRPLPNCIRRTNQFVDQKLASTLSFYCGFFTEAMFDQATNQYGQMTTFLTGIKAPVAASDVISWLGHVNDDNRDDYQVVFSPKDLDFWLARAKTGEGKETGARFQLSQHYNLNRLLKGQSTK
jgi:hypothetical protein